MGNKEFSEMAIEAVVNYYNNQSRNHEVDFEELKKEEVFIVWICKVLYNNKALLSTERLDGMYYEITYDGNRGMYYLDAYKKVENVAVPLFGDQNFVGVFDLSNDHLSCYKGEMLNL